MVEIEKIDDYVRDLEGDNRLIHDEVAEALGILGCKKSIKALCSALHRVGWEVRKINVGVFLGFTSLLALNH